MIKSTRGGQYYKEILSQLHTREIQGAFGYFYIINKFNSSPKHTTTYLDNVRNWYGGTNYKDEMQRFKTYFFIPIVDLFEWFLRESATINPNDYFSEETRHYIISRIDELEESLNLRMDVANQIIFEEVEEVKELITFLHKKNWIEIIKEKFRDLALTEVISRDVANSIVETLTGTQIDLFK